MRLLHCFILSFWYLTLQGQVSITGKILDENTSESLAGANIYLLTDFQKGTVSDENGVFSIALDPTELNDTVLFTFIGYEEQLYQASKIPEIVKMKQKQLKMASVEIVAQPLITEEFNNSKIEKLDIYKNPSAKADPLLAVNSLPSSTTLDESASISFRGSGPTETGIFLNGVPVYDAVRFAQLNGIGTFSLFNTSLVKNVTVFPGNPPLEFGNTTSGVVAIQTDDQKLKSNSNSLILSPANIGIQRNQKLGNAGLKVFSNYQPSEMLQAINPNALDQLQTFNSIDLGGYLYGDIGKRISYKSYNYTLSENYKYRLNHPTFKGIFDQSKIRAFNASSIEMKTKMGIWKWNQGYSFSNSKFQYSATDINTKNRAIFQSISLHKRASKLHYKFGLNLDSRHSKINGEAFVYDFAMAENHPTTAFSEESDATLVETFAYAKYYLTEKFIIGSGMRKNINALNERNYLSAQINSSYEFHENWKLITGIGVYHKLGLIENQARSLFMESRQTSVDLFYDKNALQMSLSLFAKDNVIDTNNIQIRGLEFYLKHRIFSKLDYSISITSLSGESNSEASNLNIDYFIRGNLTYQAGKYWDFSLNGIIRQGTTYNAILNTRFDNGLQAYIPLQYDQERLNNYAILNTSVSRIIPVNEDLVMIGFLSINNVFDRKNIRNYTYNFNYSQKEPELFSERIAYLGIQLNF